jgi:hypothetical protein
MADLKDLAKQYGLEDYEQLLGGYPNAEKFLTGLKDAAVRAVPTTEQMRDPNFIIDAAGLGGAIKAYHGTPHLFDRFDMSKIGTGEGAQAYGHGLYFAENPLVAESYRKNLSKDADVIYQAELNGVPIDIRDLKGAPNLALASLVTDPSRSIDDIIKIYREGDHSKPYARLWPDVADFLDKNRDNIKIYDEPIKQTGNLYETSIRWPNAEREATDPLGEHHLLDLDAPLASQSDYVRDKLLTLNDPFISKAITETPKYNETGDFWNYLDDAYESKNEALNSVTPHEIIRGSRGSFKNPKEISESLNKIDIPGLKYLDATSRSTDKGIRNYVMFGDEYPEIIKRAGSLDELQEKYAQGGIVKAQDQNENLGKLAEMLGSARDVGNQYTVPSWVPLAGGVGAGDLLMGKTPEEIENWSYGNAPMQIPEMSNVPQFKRGRAQSLADALTTLAPGVKATEGLPAGLSFIGPKSRNWDKVAAELAAKKLDEGADPAEVWREHLIGRMPDKTLFSEISDKEMSHVIPLNKWVNRENGQFMAPNISTAWDEAASTLTPNAPVRIKRLFEHDQLKNEYPYGFTKNYENQSIMDMPVFMQEKNSKSYGSLGDEDLTLNPSLLPKEARSTVLHELQHAIQNQEGWGKGGSPEEFQLSDFAKSYWQNIYDKSNDQQSELLQSLLEKKKAGEIDNNDIRLQMESLANRNGRSIAETMLRRDKNPIESYKRLAGEAQARATQDRLDMDMVQRRENYPLAGGKLSDIPLEDLIYKYEGNGPSLSMDPLSKYKDYVGEHSAPLGDSGAPLHDLAANENAIYPSDVYSSKANQYYGSGEPEDAQLFAMAQRLKDKPNEKVSIYRAVPKMQSNSEKIAGLEKDLANYMKRGRMPKNADFDNKSDWYEWASNERDRLASLPEETIEPLSINHGDWVALDKKYAKEHGESALGGNYKIISKKVPARQLFTNGDSIREWGWDSRYAQGGSVDKDSLQLDKPQRTPNHPTKSHIVKTMVDGKEKIIRFGEQGAQTAGKPKEGESDRMTAKRESFKARHAKNIAKGKSSAAYWADKVKWAEGGEVDLSDDEGYADDLARLKKAYERSNFGPNDSVIASTIHHPIEAAKRYGQHLNDMYAIATDQLTDAELAAAKDAGYDEESYPLYAMEHPIFRTDAQKAEAGMEFAGLAQTGAMPFAPESAGGLLGSILRPNSQLGTIGSKREKKPITELEEGVKLGKRISTATPTDIAAKKMDYHSTPEHIITLDTMRSNPEAFEKNMRLMAEYMPFSETDTNKQADLYRKYFGDNLKYFIKNAPEDFTQRSGNWYKGANALANDMSNAYNIPIEASAGVLARLSPQQNWLHNVEQADRVADIFTNHQNTVMPVGKYKGTKLKDLPNSLSQAEWIKDFDQHTTQNEYYGITPEGALSDEIVRTKTGEPSTFVWQSFPNLSRAVDILKDPSIENVSKSLGLGGHKIRNFYNNIADPFHPEDVTIDTHAGAAALFTPYSASAIPIGHLFGGGAKKGIVEGSSKSGMAHGMYGLYADAYRDVAKDLNLPAQSLQSQIWELVRETFPTMGKEKMQKQIQTNVLDELKKGKITEEEARNKILDIATKGKGFLLPDWYTQDYAKGGEVKALHDKYEESDYGYGNRPDKTKKGLGYFGELERPDGTGVMTEYSIGVPINGEEMDVPTLVPTLTPDEIRLILHLQEGEDMPRSIVHKAIDHAHQRLSEGKPIFATEEDLYAHGGIVDVLHNDAIEQIMKAFMDSMEDEQEEEEPAAVSIQITTHSQPLKSGKIPTSIREAKHG